MKPFATDLQAVADFLDPQDVGDLPDLDTCQRVGKFLKQLLVRVPGEDPSDLRTLLIRGTVRLREWHTKYGEHQPQWLPPAGDVRWLEDAEAALAADVVGGA